MPQSAASEHARVFWSAKRRRPTGCQKIPTRRCARFRHRLARFSDSAEHRTPSIVALNGLADGCRLKCPSGANRIAAALVKRLNRRSSEPTAGGGQFVDNW
jgi:hypothetical protein